MRCTHVLDWRRDVQLCLILGVESLLEGLEAFFHSGLHSSALLQRDSALLHPLQRLCVFLHDPANSDPILSGPTLQNMGPPIHRLSSESTAFPLRLENFLALQMAFKHESEVSSVDPLTYIGWSLKPLRCIGIPSELWLNSNSASSRSSRFKWTGRCNIVTIPDHQSGSLDLLGGRNFAVFAPKFLAYRSVTSRA